MSEKKGDWSEWMEADPVFMFQLASLMNSVVHLQRLQRQNALEYGRLSPAALSASELLRCDLGCLHIVCAKANLNNYRAIFTSVLRSKRCKNQSGNYCVLPK